MNEPYKQRGWGKMLQIEGTACAEGLWPLGVSELKEGLTGRGSDGEMRQRGKHRAD